MIQLKHITITYGNLKVIEPTDFNFYKGELTALIGESGCGKSSVLDVLAYQNKENHYDYLETQDKESFLKSQLSYIKQDVELIDYMTCIDQLIWASKVAGKEKTKEAVMEVLKRVELEEVADKKPSQLSGGQRQRLGVALAIIKESEVILLDEITSALDKEHVDLILRLLKQEAQKGKYIILATHDPEIYKQCDHIYHFEDGKVIEERITSKDNEVFEVTKENNTSKKNLNTLVKAFSKHYIKNRAVISLMLALIIGLCTTGFLLNNKYTEVIDESLDSIRTNQSYIINGEHYLPIPNPIDKGMISEIENLKGIENIYPFYSFDLYRMLYDIDSGTESQTDIVDKYGTVLSAKDSVKEYTFPIEELDTVYVHVYPSYDDLNLDARSDTFLDIEQGVYITENLAKVMNITSLDYQPEITIRCGIPIGNINDEEYLYKMVELTLPIKGILSATHVGINSAYALYYDYDLMNQLYDEAVSQNPLPDGVKPFENRAYTLFTDKMDVLDDIEAQLENTPLHLQNNTLDLVESLSPFMRIRDFLNQYTYILTIATLLICLIYGVYMYHQKKASYDTLRHWGIQVKEIRHMLKVECFSQIKLILPLSFLAAILFLFLAYRMNYFIAMIDITDVIITLIYFTLLVFISLALMQVYSLVKIRGGYKHK